MGSRIRSDAHRHRRYLAVAAVLGVVLGVVLAGTAGVVVWQTRPACADGRILATVPGDEKVDLDSALPPSVTSAMRVVRNADAFEGVWVGPDRRAYIGVYGPRWVAARDDALAAARGTGITTVFVCQPVTEHDLVLAQQRVGADPQWQRSTIGFSSIDIQHAAIVVGILRSAPRSVDGELRRRVGPTLVVQRLADPLPDFGPETGRMPLARDDPQARATTGMTTANG